MTTKKRVVIVGAGFAGLFATQTLAKHNNIEITLIDRNNFHTFTPLLYQVATCALDPATIAYPVRTIFRDHENVHFLMGEVVEMNTTEKFVNVQTNGTVRRIPYDYLLVATGSVTNYFGQKAIEQNSYGLKDLDEAVQLRHHILKLFEKAAWVEDGAVRDALTTLVVVGGGPTGIETAGALYELYNYVLKHEYKSHYPRLRARVILLEATGTLLGAYPERLQKAAEKQLADIGVEVMLNAAVADVKPDRVTLKDGRIIPTYTLVWAAGVKASPIAEMLKVPLQRAGRLPVLPTLQVEGKEGVYAAGDLVYLEDENGKPYPMLIPVAQQQGILAARNILHEMRGTTQEAFRYFDKGIMATIGRSRAVAWVFYRIQLTGLMAWLVWIFLHLIMLMGFRNRLSAFISWVWNYVTYDRSVRIILDKSEAPVVSEKRLIEIEKDIEKKTA